jgi:hypothetical protein
MNELKLIEIFCKSHDFCQKLDKYSQSHRLPGSMPTSGLSLSEIMSICMAFHLSGYKTFKHFYTRVVLANWKSYFPNLVCYSHFVQLQQGAVLPLYAFLWSECIGGCQGLSFIDSFKVAVCHNRRIFSHRVFEGLAARGKTSVDWFYGFKLHVTINPKGELLGFALSKGNTDDRNHSILKQVTRRLKGILVGDRGYIGKALKEDLAHQGIHLLTKIKSNMKNALIDPVHKLFLKKRALIESVIDRIKETTSIEHTRHRSPVNFLVNTFAALAAYCFIEDKPHLHFVKAEVALLHD